MLHVPVFLSILRNCMKKMRNSIVLSVVFLFLVSIIGCSKHIGYGVVNWSAPEYGLKATDVVPVLVKSNISNMYIVELDSKKVEIPLWQLTFCKSKRAASAYIEKLNEYRSMYASVKRDGLPLRAKPKSTGKQVYRLRKNQIVKILWKGEGDPVIARDKPLEGQWFQVMTNDGTQGWCFSYNLHLYEEGNAAVAQVKKNTQPDELLQSILQERWYPEYYHSLIMKKYIDLKRITKSFGFFPNTEKGVAQIVLEKETLSFPYTGIRKNRMGAYIFTDSSLFLQIKNEHTIIVQYTDKKGHQHAEHFITLDEDLSEILEAEKIRRSKALYAVYTTGPKFNSGSYGTLSFSEDNRFIWNGYQVLSPSVIPKKAGQSGYVSTDIFLSRKLKADYQGVLSFKFDGSKEPIDFLYNLSPQGLKLEYLKPKHIEDGVAVTRNLNPVILFFEIDGAAF